jgi:hypothetical protein
VLTATKNRGERKLRHSGSRTVGAVGRECRGGTRRVWGEPGNLHSVHSLVSCLQRDGVNMAEERRTVRVEERLKIKIGEFYEL